MCVCDFSNISQILVVVTALPSTFVEHSLAKDKNDVHDDLVSVDSLYEQAMDNEINKEVGNYKLLIKWPA